MENSNYYYLHGLGILSHADVKLNLEQIESFRKEFNFHYGTALAVYARVGIPELLAITVSAYESIIKNNGMVESLIDKICSDELLLDKLKVYESESDSVERVLFSKRN